MAPYTITLLDGEPIVIWAFTEEYSPKAHMAAANEDALSIFESAAEPVIIIADLRDFKLTIDEMLFGANFGARGSSSAWRHPNIRETVVISSSPLVQMAIKGLDSATFGHMKIKVVATLEDALEYARNRTAA